MQSSPYIVGLEICFTRSVKDPRDGRRVALKKIPNVFHNVVTAKRVLRELKMLCYVKHENVRNLCCLITSSVLKGHRLEFTVLNVMRYHRACDRCIAI